VKKIILLFVLLIFIFSLSSSSALAAKLDNRETVILPKDEIVNSDYFAWGQNVTIQGTVNGDAYIAGGKVIIEGEINGDLIAAGGQLNIRGKILNDVRIAAGQSIISADIGGNLTTIGGTTEITESANLLGSLVAGVGSINVFSAISKGATIGAGDATIGNKIKGDVLAAIDTLILTQNAQLEGDLTYYSRTKAQIQQGAVVEGTTKHNLPAKQSKNGFDQKNILGLSFLSLVASLIIGFVLIKFMPNFTNFASDTVMNKTLKSSVVGLISIIIIPIITFVLLITIIGIPFALLVIALYILALFIAKIFVAIAAGQKVIAYFGLKDKGFLALFAGLVLYTVSSRIPIIGNIIVILTIVIGFGALMITKYKTIKEIASKKII